MALRLSELVVRGELFNLRRNCVHGWLELRGFEQLLLFELTGNPRADLAGRHIRFQVRGSGGDETDAGEAETSLKGRMRAAGLGNLAWRQVGPVGDITADRRVRVTDCPPREQYLRSRLGEPPPTEWKPCLYLEWYSQNGRVVIELADPEIEYVAAREWPPLPAAEGAPVTGPLEIPTGDELAGASPGESCEFELTDPAGEDACDCADGDDFGCGCDESWGVVPSSLQQELDAQNRELDEALRGDAEENETIRELRLMDDLIDRGEGEPLGSLMDEVLKLPPPDQVTEEQARESLMSLLAALATYGVALHMCEHVTYRDAYRLMVEHLREEGKAYAELRGTGWVQHFDTAEYCTICEAEMAREFESRGSLDDEPPPENPAGPPDQVV